MFRTFTGTVLERLLSAPPRTFRTTIITNANQNTRDVAERVVEPGATAETVRLLGLSYPRDIYSLSHVALPFPLTDGLYGLTPDPADAFGIRLDNVSTRGELGVLVVSLDTFSRMSSNPLHPYMMERVRGRASRADKAASKKDNMRRNTPYGYSAVRELLDLMRSASSDHRRPWTSH